MVLTYMFGFNRQKRFNRYIYMPGLSKYFLFHALLRPFRETHCVKCCDKNVSLFLIVRRKMAYLGVPKKVCDFKWL